MLDLKLEEAVLFPFDDFSIPLKYRLKVGLISATSPWKPHEIVLSTGKPGTPDSDKIRFYGSVIRVGDQFRMWYIGMAGDDSQVCYAVSKDGVHWEKPTLGLVKYRGITQNNLVNFGQKGIDDRPESCLVLFEPDDPDPNRRFKMVYEVNPFDIRAAFSPDGLNWKDSPNNPIIKHNSLEPGGLIKYNGCYYVNGQGGSVGTKRALVTNMSFDFENWSDAVILGFRRDVQPYRQFPGGHAGEQVHLGASLWNRGNVVLGFYGQWHGPECNDRGWVTMDIGLVVSNDAMHYREPIPDFQIISSYEVDRSSPFGPALMQGQGFENFKDQTLFWYSPWRSMTGFICVAKFPRDRLGYFAVVGGSRKPGVSLPEDVLSIMPEYIEPHFISCPIQLDHAAQLFINADGLSDEAFLKVEILDQQFEPQLGYSAYDCMPIKKSGFRQPVSWNSNQTINKFEYPIRIKIIWEGTRPEDAYLYAVYVSQSS